jgi:uncharacterized protein YjaG (DUF416 family)
MLDVNPMLSPDQKLMYAISTAERYGTLKTLPELESIANASNNFRDIKRQVTNGVQLKQEPLFTNEIPKLNYVSDSAQTLLENFNNNKTSKNVLIFDSTALSKNPKLSSELDKITTVTSMENINNVVPNLVSGSTMSPTFRLVINDATDAKTLSGLKGLIERSNETQYPTKLIIEDRFGKLDPAILSRGEVVTGKDIIGTTPKKKAPSNVSQMLTPEDTFKALKQDVPRSEMSITEGKIFDMTQAERNAYEQTLKTELSKAKYDMDKKLIQNALNLIEKYRYK